jgi:hypothetical protein
MGPFSYRADESTLVFGDILGSAERLGCSKLKQLLLSCFVLSKEAIPLELRAKGFFDFLTSAIGHCQVA